jgi:sialate O-acetylesterase
MKLAFKVFFILFYTGTFANITLPAVFCDNMVLQQNSNVAFWGTASPNEAISIFVSWSKKTYTIKATEAGFWKLDIPTTKGSFQEQIITLKGDNDILISHVLLGEVWFSSGQSNMEWVMCRVKEAKKELSESNYPNIRLFNITKKIADTPHNNFPKECKWLPCDSVSVKEFSAISYYFAREMHLKLKMPIGIITANWGGTGAECWTTEENNKSNPALKNLYVRWENWDLDRKKDSLSFSDSKSKGIKMEEPQSVYMTNRPHRRPSVLYNGMVAPLIPYTIKGVIWYQGTSNREWANEYYEQMNALISGWRKNWNKPDLPFYFLQLSAFKYSDSNLASIIRENQLKTLQIPNTAMCPTVDIGDLNDLHYPYKLPYGMRLANIALANSYSKKIDFCGPLYSNYSIKKDSIEITFKYNKNLNIKGAILNDIFIAGEDKKFVKAQTYIKNNKLIVFSQSINSPVSVRYAWNNTDKANLFNGSNLPASPFRTDNWENIIIE